MLMSVNSYPGIAGGAEDCIECHNEPATTGYETDFANVQGVIDGNFTETFWNGDLNRIYVPVGDNEGYHEFELVQTTFAQNSTHIFVMVRIHDNDNNVKGAASPYYGVADKVALMWNINATSVGMAYPSAMGGTYSATEAADLWMWAPSEDHLAIAEDLYTPLAGNSYDGSLQPTITADSSNDVTAAGMYNTKQGHAGFAKDLYVEFARPLVTDDTQDVQFDHSGYFEYTLALWNGTNGAKHHVSFSHYVWVNNGAEVYETATRTVDVTNTVDATNTVDTTITKSETPLPTVGIFFGLISTAFIAIYKKRN
jgi:hypothetical protein